jgi:putative ABC transport system permease protein
VRSLTALRIVVHDRSSTAGSVLGVIAIVFLVGQQLSILFGLLSYMSVLVDHSGADAWILSANARNVDAVNQISARYLHRVIGLEEVQWAEPLLNTGSAFRRLDGSIENVRVVGVRRPRMVGGPWEFAQGDERALLDREAVTVDRLDLEKLGNPRLHQVTEVGERAVHVGAMTDGARGFQGTLVFTSLDKAQEITKSSRGRYSAILVKFREGVDKQGAIQRLRAILPECSVFGTAELSNLTRTYYLTNTGIGGSFGFSTTIGVLIGMVIISLTMYTGVMGRATDFAVMRAMGARKSDVAVVVFVSTLIIAVVGLFLGFVMLSTLLNATGRSEIPSYFPSYLPFFLAVGTLVVSILGSLIAVRQALKADPSSVFH